MPQETEILDDEVTIKIRSAPGGVMFSLELDPRRNVTLEDLVQSQDKLTNAERVGISLLGNAWAAHQGEEDPLLEIESEGVDD